MMKSLICDSPGVLRLAQVPMPVRRPDQVLLRIRRVGICGTDLHIFQGTQPYLNYPRVMGHELSGEVVEAPAGSGLAPGDQVYVMPYMSCGACHACRQGKTNCCMKIEVLGVHCDGGLTEYLALPARFAFKTDGISLDDAAMLEFLAIGAHAVRRAAIGVGQKTLVVGAGPIGIAVTLFARLHGADVTVLDTRADRLAFCRDVLAVPQAVQAGPDDHEQLRQLSGGDFFDVVFDATGNPTAMERGFALVAHGGTYVLVSIVSGPITFSDPEFHKREMTLKGSRNATVQDFEEVLAAMRAGHVPTGALNTHRATLEQLPALLPGWLAPSAGVIKALVEC